MTLRYAPMRPIRSTRAQKRRNAVRNWSLASIFSMFCSFTFLLVGGLFHDAGGEAGMVLTMWVACAASITVALCCIVAASDAAR
jgi:hypothetical protein